MALNFDLGYAWAVVGMLLGYLGWELYRFYIRSITIKQ